MNAVFQDIENESNPLNHTPIGSEADVRSLFERLRVRLSHFSTGVRAG